MISSIRFFYNLAFPVVLLILLPGFLHRMLRRGKYRHKFGQRFGVYSKRVRERLGKGRVWVHAVSVGEVMIALKLIRTWREMEPDLRFVLSTTTSTGFQVAARAKSPGLEPIYNPLDFFPVARKAMRTIRPSHFVLVEAEAWPNLLAEAKAVGARVVMVNTRLSARSERRFRSVRWLAAPVFNQIDFLCLQEPGDVARWESLGVDLHRLVVTGSIKFDEEAVGLRADRDFFPVLRVLGVPAGAPVLVGGSTFDGEEEILGRVLLRLRKTYPDLFLVVVPRHFERSGEVVSKLQSLGLRVVRRMQNGEAAPADVLVVDTTGELRDWYSYATVAFVGKSLTARGGQNPAEPVSAGVPVVFGPHMSNFATLAAQFVRNGGALQVRDEAELNEEIGRLLGDSNLRGEVVAKASLCLRIHRGATRRTCELLARPITFR